MEVEVEVESAGLLPSDEVTMTAGGVTTAMTVLLGAWLPLAGAATGAPADGASVTVEAAGGDGAGRPTGLSGRSGGALDVDALAVVRGRPGTPMDAMPAVRPNRPESRRRSA